MKVKIKRFLLISLVIFFIYTPLFAVTNPSPKYITVFQGLNILRCSYPDVQFDPVFDYSKGDYRVTVKVPGRDPKDFYWCGGSLLPEEELPNKDAWWSILYSYPEKLEDPLNYTAEQKEALKNFSSRESRKTSAGTPMFFFDYLYSSETQRSVERHIKSIMYFNHPTKVHERILEPARRAEKRIMELSKTDEEVRDFVEKIKSDDAYYWRLIDGTNRRSFHALGIAIDFIPKRITGEIFWSWARDKNPSGWMLTPLSKRWMPPEKVIQIYEEEGFIWGGKWAIWDNMHFEYHPELINFNFHKDLMYISSTK